MSTIDKEDAIILSLLRGIVPQWHKMIDEIADEYKIDDSVAVANLKKSVAAITGTLVGWVINKGK